MFFKNLLPVAVFCFFCSNAFSQLASLSSVPSGQFVPVTLNAPNFKYDKELSVGVSINNYGFYESIDFKNKNIIYLISAQHNDGKTQFNPFHLGNILKNESWLISSDVAEQYYFEAALGYNFKLEGETFEGQNLDIIAGTGRDITNQNQRYFVQADLSNDFRLINIGLSARGNYTKVGNVGFATLDPAVQARIKIWDLRVSTQFGYCIILKTNQDYMVPVFTAGLGYVFHKHEKNPVKEVRKNYDFSY